MKVPGKGNTTRGDLLNEPAEAMFVASEEATSGSVIANAERISAFGSGCGQRLFCSGVPKYASTSMLPALTS